MDKIKELKFELALERNKKDYRIDLMWKIKWLKNLYKTHGKPEGEDIIGIAENGDPIFKKPDPNSILEKLKGE